MSGQYILDGHEPVVCEDILEWARWFEKSSEARCVADDQVGGAWVSTVFLGLDHSFGPGPPVLFETMVFEGPLDGTEDRYSTWQEAEEGHRRMVALVKKDDPASADRPPTVRGPKAGS